VGLSQLIDQNTRKSNILDLLLTNDPLLVSDFFIDVPFSNSDHESITVLFLVDNFLTNSAEIVSNSMVLSWKQADWNRFALFIYTIDWSTVS
jgi:hypothetical protein